MTITSICVSALHVIHDYPTVVVNVHLHLDMKLIANCKLMTSHYIITTHIHSLSLNWLANWTLKYIITVPRLKGEIITIIYYRWKWIMALLFIAFFIKGLNVYIIIMTQLQLNQILCRECDFRTYINKRRFWIL